LCPLCVGSAPARLKLIANGFVGVRGATIVVAGIRKPSQ